MLRLVGDEKHTTARDRFHRSSSPILLVSGVSLNFSGFFAEFRNFPLVLAEELAIFF